MDKATFEHRQEGNKGAGHAKTVGRKKRLGLAEGQSRCKISEEGGCLACPRNSRGTQCSQGNGRRKGSAQEIRAGSL